MTLQRQNGFTLVEIAIVMVIIGLVMGGGMAIMRTLSDRKFRNESIDHLNMAKKTVITFAQINGRLPFADTNADGDENASQTIGDLPFITLGIPPSDPYGRPIAYEINATLITDINNITNMVASCNALMTGLSGSPQIRDAEAGAGSAFPVAAVLVSSGPMDADSDGDVFDDIAGASGGDNTDGTPNYIRNPPLDTTFDDLVVYISGNELFGDMCENVVLTANDTSGAAVFYVRDLTRGTDLGSANPPANFSDSVISGTQIEIRSGANGGGAALNTIPPTPFTIAGQDRTIVIIP